MNKLYKIRISILNIPLVSWKEVNKIKKDGIIEVSVKYFYDKIAKESFGDSLKYNLEEKEFCEKYYNYVHKTRYTLGENSK